MFRTRASNEDSSDKSLFIEASTASDTSLFIEAATVEETANEAPSVEKEVRPIEVMVTKSKETSPTEKQKKDDYELRTIVTPIAKQSSTKETVEDDEETRLSETADVEYGKPKSNDAPSADQDDITEPRATPKRKKQSRIILGIFVLFFIIALAVGMKNSVETSQNDVSPSLGAPTLLPVHSPAALPIFGQAPEIPIPEGLVIPTNDPAGNSTASPTTLSDTSSAIPKPTDSPTMPPTPAPTRSPTPAPTRSPTKEPTRPPTVSPTDSPIMPPTPAPTHSPTKEPTRPPTVSPTVSPTTTAPTSSAQPTIDLRVAIDEFLEDSHDAEIGRKDWYGNPSSMAVDWIASETTLDTIQLDDRLVQRFALLALDFSLQKAKGWEEPRNAEKHVDHCFWRGIGCDENGMVEKIEWSYLENGKKGPITPEIKHLESLKHLDLSNNYIDKKIPEEFYQLTNLESVYLYNNKLKGSISTQIGNLKSLQYFNLANNKKLWGSIPNELGSCEDLIYFNVYSNQLSGTLPQSLKLKNLWYFDVGRNYLRGTLPEEYGEQLRGLRHLHLDHNYFSGSLPLSYNFVGNGRLETLSIDNNKLTGVVPGERKLYNKLVQFTLQKNDFHSMEPGVCRSVIPLGEMPELRANCAICSCESKFNISICELQCYQAPTDPPTSEPSLVPTEEEE